MSDALQALYAGDPERGRRLLPSDDRLSVFEAAAFGRLQRLESILADDPSHLDARSDDGFAPLHLAVFGGQAEAARLLLGRGADPDALSSGPIAQVPPLGTAAFVRSEPLARVLLEAGADPNARGAGGFAALHTAAANGDVALVRLLLDRGADARAVADDGRSPIVLAGGPQVRALLMA
jgi:ankyrin repeat protein